MATLKRLCETHIENAGSVQEGVKRFASDTASFLKDGTLKPEDVSIREVFEQTTCREYKEKNGEEIDLATTSSVKLAESIGHSHFPYITKELINKELIPEYEVNSGGVEALVSEMSTNRTDYDYVAGINAMSQMMRVRPGQPYPNAEFGEKRVRIELAKFGEILNLEKELIMQDQTGKVLDRARTAGKFMGEHKHRYIVETIMDIKRDALDEATSTAFHFDGSAVGVYSNDHSSSLGQALDNISASSGIATASLDSAYGLFGAMKDEEGRYITVTPKVLLVHPTKFRIAWQLCSDLTQPDTANRGSNFYKQALGLQPFQSPYVGTGGGASTDWYLGDFKRQIVWMWVLKPYTDSEGADSTAAFERDIVARFKYGYSAGCGHRDVRFIVKCTA